MRKLGLVLVLVALVVAVGVAQSKPNLAGSWVIDKAKSDAPMMGRGPGGGGGGRGPGGGGGGEVPDITLTITQTDKALTIDRQMGDQSQKITLKLDGTDSVNPGMRGGEMKSTARLDGSTIVNEGSQSVSTPRGDMTIETKEVYSVSADGKVLTIETTSKTPRGEQTRKQVFAKKTT